MSHNDYMRYLEYRRKEIERERTKPTTEFDLEKAQERIRKDQEMHDKYMREMFSFKGFFPELADVPVFWIIVGIVSGLFCLLGVLL